MRNWASIFNCSSIWSSLILKQSHIIIIMDGASKTHLRAAMTVVWSLEIWCTCSWVHSTPRTRQIQYKFMQIYTYLLPKITQSSIVGCWNLVCWLLMGRGPRRPHTTYWQEGVAEWLTSFVCMVCKTKPAFSRFSNALKINALSFHFILQARGRGFECRAAESDGQWWNYL